MSFTIGNFESGLFETEKVDLPISLIATDRIRPSSVGSSTKQPTRAFPSGILAL